MKALQVAREAVIVLVIFGAAAGGTRLAGATFLAPRTGPGTPLPSAAARSAMPFLPPAASSVRPIPSRSPSPKPNPVSAAALVKALQDQPLAADPDLIADNVSGPTQYVPPGDTLPSPRLVGGVEYQIRTGPNNSVFVDLLIFEGAQDAAADMNQELVSAQAGGAPYSTRSVDGSTVACSPDGIACVVTVGRASIRAAGGANVDVPAVLPAARAAIRTVAAARAKAVARG